jgi:hypothetical protein
MKPPTHSDFLCLYLIIEFFKISIDLISINFNEKLFSVRISLRSRRLVRAGEERASPATQATLEST